VQPKESGVVVEQEHKLGNEALGSDRPLSVPHFDDEATLLSARPVVPFHELNAKSDSKRRLVFGLTLVTALIIGALGGTLLYARRESAGRALTVKTAQPTSEPVTQDDLVSSSGEAGASAIASNGAETLAASQEDRTTTGQIQRPNTSTIVKRQTPSVSMSDSRSANAREIEQGEQVDLEYERRIRRANRRDARRLRRQYREKARSADDLMRIREIFEGSPRPE
jgi:uncharacterized membrane protein